MDKIFLKRMAVRLEDYASSGKRPGKRPFRAPQVQVFRDEVVDLERGNGYGHIKRPTGTGKTMNYAGEIEAWDLPAIVLTPSINQTSQIKDTFLNKDFFNFDPDQIGVYHSGIPKGERLAALKSPILITTYASYARLSGRGILSGRERPIMILDEVHHARGDVISGLVRTLFGEVYVQGWTATDTFITGQNIGHYLFNGRSPIHVTTIPQAVDNGEITPYKNIIVETHLGSGTKIIGGQDYSREQLDNIVMEAGRDEAAIRMFLEFRDEETGLRFGDMKPIWYCAGVNHAERVAKKLRDILGKDYALAVSGQTPKKDLDAILKGYKNGEIHDVTSADLLIEGFDSPSTQLAMMLRPTRSPIVAEQAGGRVLRIDPNNPGKIGYIATFIDDGMYDVVPFGLVAGNMFYIPGGRIYYPATAHGTKKLNPHNDAEVSVEVHSSQIALDEFVKRRNENLGLGPDISTQEELEKAKIIAAYKPSNGNASEVARDTHHTPKTIRNIWKGAGLELRVQNSLTQSEIDKINAEYEPSGGNASEAGRTLGRTTALVLKYWKLANFKTRHSDEGLLTKQQIETLVAAYEPNNGNAALTARQFGYGAAKVIRYWRKHGLEIKPHSLTEAQKDVINHMYEPYGGNVYQAAKDLGHGWGTVARQWKARREEEFMKKALPIIEYKVRRMPMLDDREGAVQESAAAVLEEYRKGTLRDPDKVDAWIGKIAQNTAAYYRRGETRESMRRAGASLDDVAPFLDSHVNLEEEVLHKLELEENIPGLKEALEGLTKRERDAVILKYAGDMSSKEIAIRLGTTENNINQITYRALLALREGMLDYSQKHTPTLKRSAPSQTLQEFIDKFHLVGYKLDEHARDPSGNYSVSLMMDFNGVKVKVFGESKNQAATARRDTLEAALDAALRTPDGSGLLPVIAKLARGQFPPGTAGAIQGSYENGNARVSVLTRYAA